MTKLGIMTPPVDAPKDLQKLTTQRAPGMAAIRQFMCTKAQSFQQAKRKQPEDLYRLSRKAAG